MADDDQGDEPELGVVEPGITLRRNTRTIRVTPGARVGSGTLGCSPRAEACGAID
jgi:hypothetical protein